MEIKKTLYRTGLALVLTFSSISVIHAQQDDTYLRIAEKSGMLLSTRSMADQFGLGLEQGFLEAGAPHDLAFRVRIAAKQTINIAEVENEAVESLRTHLPNHIADEVEIWLDTNLGAKISELEKAIHEPEVYNAILSSANTNSEADRDSKRDQLIQRLDKATQLSFSTVDLAMSIQTTVLKAFFASLPEETRPSNEQLAAGVEANRFQMQGMINQQIYTTMLYTYKDLSNQELNQYIDWLESDTGQFFSKASVSTHRSTMNQVAQHIGQTTANELRNWSRQAKAEKISITAE